MNTLNTYLKRILAMALLLPGLALAAEGQLLGLSIEHPQVNGSVNTSLMCGYDGTTLTLQSQASNIQFVPAGAFSTIFGNNTGTVFGGLINISAPINASGNLQAGATLTVTGFYQDSGLAIRGPTLLTADITDFGILDSGTTDLADFKISVTGGDVTTDPDWASSPIGGIIVDLVNSGYAGSSNATGFSASWNCDASKATIGLTPVTGGTDPFDCFAVNMVKIVDKPGTTRDRVVIKDGGFRLDTPNSVDLNTDTVTISVGGNSYTFAPGSFVMGGSGDYRFKSATGAVPKIAARLNFTKATWELKVKGDDVSGFMAGAIDVTLSIGGFSSTETVTLAAKAFKGGSKGKGSKGSNGNGKLQFKAKPKKTCRLPGQDSSDSGTPMPGKMSCISSLTVEHTSGRQITKGMVTADLFHPNTVFTDSVTGDMAIFHTSCSQCLMCGDTDGTFTIVNIGGTEGDKLAQKCGVPDASCSIVLP